MGWDDRRAREGKQTRKIVSVLREEGSNTSLSGRSKTRTNDKYRVVYSDHQRLELEREFHFSKYITIRRKAELAQALELSERQVRTEMIIDQKYVLYDVGSRRAQGVIDFAGEDLVPEPEGQGQEADKEARRRLREGKARDGGQPQRGGRGANVWHAAPFPPSPVARRPRAASAAVALSRGDMKCARGESRFSTPRLSK